MISSKDIQNKYVNLYRQLRYYIWDIDFVEDLAELEVAIYDSFPESANMKKLIKKLKHPITEVIKDNDDTELEEAFNSLEEAINNSDNLYLELYQVQEVLK